MVLRQFQDANRRVWNIPDDRNTRPMVPKNQDTCQLFGAYLPIFQWHFYKILRKTDFFKFNELHNIRDPKGNVRPGMVGLFYEKVCRMILNLISSKYSIFEF